MSGFHRLPLTRKTPPICSMYINPDECVDCGACKPIWRMEAIYYETDLPEDQEQHFADNAAFFRETLPGRDGPLARPAALPT